MAEGGKLSEEEIFECLKSLNVPVRMNDLKVPSREFIVRVFECFLKDLQIDITSYELRTWEATNHIEDADIYDDAQLLILLAMSVNHITDPCGLNITIRDIVEPKPKRTKKILNYILVFWNYYLQKYARFSAIEEVFEGERKKAEDIVHENKLLDEKHDMLLKSLSNTQSSKEELLRSINMKEEKSSKLKEESEMLQTDYQNLKAKEISIKENIRTTEFDIIRAKETLNELSQRIVSSPKQKHINAEMKALEEKIKDTDAKTKECENLYKEGIKKEQQLEEFEKDQERFLSVLDELGENEKQISEVIKSMINIHEKINDEEDRVKRLQMDLDRKEEWKLQQEQKSAKVMLNRRKQLETLKEVLNVYQNEEAKEKENIADINVAIQGVQRSIDSECDQIQVLIKNCKVADARSKEREAKFRSKMRETVDKFKLDCNNVLEVIKDVFPVEHQN